MIFLLLGLSYQLIVRNQLLAPGYAQLVFLVLISLFLFKLRINGSRMPAILVIVSILISSSWFIIVSKKPDFFDAQYYLANFEEDLYGKESRKFLEDIDQFLPADSNAKIYKLNYSVGSYAEAKALLAKKKQAKVILWGNDQYINLLFPPPYNLNLDQLRLTKDLNLGLKLITDITMVRILRNPYDQTVAFTAGLLATLKQPSEISFRTTGNFYQVWHSSLHLAYLRFKLANYLFLKMLNNSDTWQDANFKCIFQEYHRAAYYLKNIKHSELAVAINNNVGVLKYLKVIFKSTRKNKKLLQKFKSTKALKTIANPLDFPAQAAAVAQWNLKVIRQLHRTKKIKNKNEL